MSDGTETAAGLPGLSRSAYFDRFWSLSEDLLVVANQKGEWLRANPSLERILGWTLEEVQGLGGWEITHPEDRDKSSAEVHKLATGEATVRFENRVRHRDGTYRCLAWKAVPADGVLYCIGRDITDERSATATLDLRNQALDAIGQGVVITDPRRRGNPMIYVNPAFERLTGYAAHEALGRNCRLLQGPETDPASIARLSAALAESGEFTDTLVNYRRDGAAFINSLHIAPVRDR